MKSIIKEHNKRNKANPIRLNFELEDQDPNEDRIVKGKEIDDEDLRTSVMSPELASILLVSAQGRSREMMNISDEFVRVEETSACGITAGRIHENSILDCLFRSGHETSPTTDFAICQKDDPSTVGKLG
ncbi:hypothetical protein Tco_1523807 [Tanacetum coccineum]